MAVEVAYLLGFGRFCQVAYAPGMEVSLKG